MRLLRLAAAAGLALGLLVPAPAQAAGACPSSSGVTVVVDFGRLGGGVQVRCANTSGTGIDALEVTGFAVTGTQRYGSAFVCRVNGLPDASSEKCINTPPADASWRYFTASNGGQWSLSQTGASGRKVTQGGFEGWSFGSGTTPGFTPRRADSGGSSGGGAAGSAAGGGSAGQTTGPPSVENSALPQPRPRKSGAASEEPSATSEAPSEPVESDQLVTAAEQDDSTSATPWLGAGLLAAMLAGVGFAAHRRRTRTNS